jgi:hypothetical protein
VSGRIVTLLIYSGPILTGMTLGVIFGEPVLALLGIIAAVSVAIGLRIAASRQKTEIKGGRFVEGRWVDFPPDPPFRLGVRNPGYLLIIAAIEAAAEVAPKVKAALEERARERKT